MESDIYIKNTWWYLKQYDYLIEKARIRGLNKNSLPYYTEKHHIVPRCIGGLDIDENYILLTYKEHVIAHMLLARIYYTNIELKHVVYLMINTKIGKSFFKRVKTKYLDEIKASAIEYIRRLRKKQVGQRYSESRKKNISKGVTGIIVSDETRKKQAITNGRRIKGPDGKIYNSIKECSIDTGITQRVIQYNIINRPERGFSYMDPPKVYKVVDPSGEIFDSIRQCGIKHGRDGKTIKNWIVFYPEFGFKYYKE